MTVASVSKVSASGLPETMRIAQAAIYLPEVQAMLRRLSEFKLGICMPHKHDEQTGEFQPLPDEVVQVESELEVSFQPADAIASQSDRFLPVAWAWRSGASTPLAVCEMIRGENPNDAERYVQHKHKPPKGN